MSRRVFMPDALEVTVFKRVFPKTRFFSWRARLQETGSIDFNNIYIKLKGIRAVLYKLKKLNKNKNFQ